MRYSFKVLSAVAAILSFGACANTSGSAASGPDTKAAADVPATPADVPVAPGQDAVASDTGVKPPQDVQTSGTEKSIIEIQKGEASVKCANATGFTNVAKGVMISGGIVVSPVNKDTKKGLAGVYIQHKGGGPFSGLYLTDKLPGTLDALKVGDTITVVGELKEYYCFTELQPVVVTPETAPSGLPTPVTVDIANIGDKASDTDNEQWESVLVTLHDVVLSSTAACAWDAATKKCKVDTSGNPISYGDMFLGKDEADESLRMASAFGVFLTDKGPNGTYPSKWPKGTRFSSITGVVEYAFGRFTFHPVSDKAIVVAP